MSVYGKAIAAIIAQAITQILALGVFSGNAATITQIIGAVVTAIAVYQIPNTKAGT